MLFVFLPGLIVSGFLFFFINTESGKKKLPKDPRPLDYHNLTSVV